MKQLQPILDTTRKNHLSSKICQSYPSSGSGNNNLYSRRRSRKSKGHKIGYNQNWHYYMLQGELSEDKESKIQNKYQPPEEWEAPKLNVKLRKPLGK